MKILPAFLLTLTLFFTVSRPVLAHPGHEHTPLSQNQTTPEEKQAIKEASNELIEMSTPSAATEKEASVSYTLAYPGILVDHPLYFLKYIRDKIIGFLISDPVKKAEFNLLNSDKQIRSARMLADNNKDEVAIDALTSSQSYMKSTVEEIKKSVSRKKDYAPILGRTRTSIRKHQEVIQNLQNTLPEKYHETLLNSEKTLNDLQSSLTKIK